MSRHANRFMVASAAITIAIAIVIALNARTAAAQQNLTGSTLAPRGIL